MGSCFEQLFLLVSLYYVATGNDTHTMPHMFHVTSLWSPHLPRTNGLQATSPEVRTRLTNARTHPPHSPSSRRRHTTTRPVILHENQRSFDSKSSKDLQPLLYQQDLEVDAKAKSARRLNDAMVYLDGPQVFACAHWYV